MPWLIDRETNWYKLIELIPKKKMKKERECLFGSWNWKEQLQTEVQHTVV